MIAQIEREMKKLSSDGYCQNAYTRTRASLSLLLPPEAISTTECAVRYRKMRNPEGGGTRGWSLDRTPYMAAPQDDLDSPEFRMVIVVGPERSGKSVGGENHLFKRLRNGPLTDTIIYLQAGPAIDGYADKELADFFRLHAEIARHVPADKILNKKKAKQVRGKWVHLLPANDGNLRQREAPFILASEIDGYGRAAAKAVEEIRGRQKSFGNQAKAYIESHPDLGWEVGVAAGWKEGTRGVFYMACPHCAQWGTPHQLAPDGMRFTLHYERDDELDDASRAALAASSARMLCPANGCLIDDEERYLMIDHGIWVHDGQTLSADGELTGERRPNETASYWLHGLNVKRTLDRVAREHLSASIHFERTRKPERIKRFYVKTLGEAYEGAGQGSRVLDPVRLRARHQAEDREGRFRRGTCPDGALFIVAAVDQGGKKFDVGFWGFDLEGRSWLLDRVTIKDNGLSGPLRADIRPFESIEDWMQLRTRVLRRMFPLSSDPDWAMPVACMVVDTGGGKGDLVDGTKSGGTWKAREFARRMSRAGETWKGWPKVKLIKGQPSKSAKEVAPGRKINTDERGHPVAPEVLEYTLNVDRLKELSVERLAVDDGGPGQCTFADDLPVSVFQELCAEPNIDGKWTRQGANETLDLFGYAESGRIMIDPDKQRTSEALLSVDHQRRPLWARPVRFGLQEGGAVGADEGEISMPAPAAKVSTGNIFSRFDALNRG